MNVTSDLPMLPSESLSRAMRVACEESRKWLGATSPNPPVGAAALDEAGNVIAIAAHHHAGEDHAEAALLKLCRAQNILSKIHTLCVTLEPCNHHGRTPPCSEAIIDAGIKRVVIGAHDPNPHVKGGGAERLRQAGIDVSEGVEKESCLRLIHAFDFFVRTGKPFVTVKRAFDEQDSMIPPGGQKIFTSQESLILAHRLRKKADAIITGSGTILADNPSLTVRHVPDYPGKRRILAIFDRRKRVPKEYIEQAAMRGLDAVFYDDLNKCIENLTARGVRDILVEAGPALSDFILASPYWAMKVDIHKAAQDRVKTEFNKDIKLPFNINGLHLNSLLPS